MSIIKNRFSVEQVSFYLSDTGLCSSFITLFLKLLTYII